MTQNVSLTPDQVKSITAQAHKLLSDDDRVDVPPSMAMDGSYQLLMMLLTSLSNGELSVGKAMPLPDVTTKDSSELEKVGEENNGEDG